MALQRSHRRSRYCSHGRQSPRQRFRDPIFPPPRASLPTPSPPNQTGSVGPVEGWRQAPFSPRWACLVSWPCSGRGRLTPQQTTGLHVTRALAPPYAPAKSRIHSFSSSLGERGTTVIQVQRPQLPGEYLVGRGTGVVFLGIGVGCRPLYACAWEALLFFPTHPPSQLLGGGHSYKWLGKGR